MQDFNIHQDRITVKAGKIRTTPFLLTPTLMTNQHSGMSIMYAAMVRYVCRHLVYPKTIQLYNCLCMPAHRPTNTPCRENIRILIQP